MTQSTGQQVDMGRVVQRAAGAVASQVAEMGAELGMCREVIDVQNARIADLETTLEERDAEVGRLRQAAAALQQRLDQSEGGEQAGEAPGES